MTTKENDYLQLAKDTFNLKYSSKEELDSTMLQNYAQHLEECGSELVSAFVLANSDSTDKYAMPTGHIITYPANTKVTAAVLQDGLYDHLVMSRILNPKNSEDDLNDEFFRGKLDTIDSSVPQKTDNPARLAYRDDGSTNDINYWTPSLGDHGRVEIVKLRHKSGRDEDATYFIAVKAGVPQAVDDFIGEYSDDSTSKNITLEQLIKSDKDHAYLRKLGERNARRLVFRVAEAIGVRIHCQRDTKAYTSKKSQEAKPMMALTLEGDFCQPLSSLEMIQHPNPMFTKPVAASLSMCVSPGKVKDQCLVMVSPYEGIIGLKMNPANRGQQETQVRTAAYPVCTGRLKSPDQVKTTGREMKKYIKGVTWERKEPKEINDKVVPGTYRSFEEGGEFVQALSDSGWNPRWGTVQYVPVVSKIANRKLN